MKLKTNEITGIYNALSQLMDKEIGFGTACKMAKAIRELEPIVKLYEQKQSELIQAYGEKDDNGELIHTDNQYRIGNIQEFTKKLNEVSGADVEVDIPTIATNELDELKVTPALVLALDKIIEY